MGDYGRPLEFGLSLVPDAADVTETRELAVRADALGLDLLGIQDHPYQWRFLETYMLMADLLPAPSVSASSPTSRTYRFACRR